MAYIVGQLSEQEENELVRRGWTVESAPAVDFDSNSSGPHPDRMRMVWVDSSMFEVMNGPDWDMSHVNIETCPECDMPIDECVRKTKCNAIRNSRERENQMNNAQSQWWYMEQLKRKTRSAEADRAELRRRLERAQDEPSKLRLKRELESTEIRLNKLKRGLLY